MSHSWGAVTNTKYIGSGIKEIKCEGHGGIIISYDAMEKQPFLSKLKTYPELNEFKGFNGGYEFEEDCDACIIFYAMGKALYQKLYNVNDDTLEKHWNSILRSLIQYNPNVYTHLSGIGVSIFESYKAYEAHLIECGHKVYKYMMKYTSEYYEIPKGTNIVRVYNIKDHKDEKYFEVSDKQLEDIRKLSHRVFDQTGLKEVMFSPQKKTKSA